MSLICVFHTVQFLPIDGSPLRAAINVEVQRPQSQGCWRNWPPGHFCPCWLGLRGVEVIGGCSDDQLWNSEM